MSTSATPEQAAIGKRTRAKTRAVAATRGGVMLSKAVYNLGRAPVVVKVEPIAYARDRFHEFVDKFAGATPDQRMHAEREGVPGVLVKDLAKRMGLANIRMFEVIGIPKATAEKKTSAKTPIAGAAGQAALGMVRLLGIAKDIVANSDSPEAKNFDTAKWLGHWIELPQPALGGRKPADMIDTPTGVETVARLLGSLESGVYL